MIEARARPLRVGVIGAGGIAQMMHLPTLAERPDLFTISALADLDGERVLAVGSRYGVPACETDARVLLDRSDLDAIIIASSGSHQGLAIAALERGRHVFVEKPLGYGKAETEAVARAARTSRAKLMIGYHKRFDPAVVLAKAALAGIKDLRYVEVTVIHPDEEYYRWHHSFLPVTARAHPPAAEAALLEAELKDGSRGEVGLALSSIVGADAPPERRLGAKILCESLIHDLNLLRSFLGEPERVISAEVWRGGFAQHSLTRFSDRVRASLSWVMVPGLMNYEERLAFVGADARLTLTFPSPYLRHAPTTLRIERMDGDALVTEDRHGGYEEAFRAELHAFRKMILEDRPADPGIDDALADAAWIEAIAQRY